MTPELFSGGWFSALASIIVIDLILAGDNAIVIGLAARNVPREMQKQVILWGTAGAIVVRALLTDVVVWLLKIPGFLLVGGLALVYIGWKLTHDGGGDPEITAKSSVRGAVQTIVIADAVMGVGGLVAIPVLRVLSASHRFQVAALVFVAAWLTGFGWLDDRLSEAVDPAGAWQWDESIVDFVRWIGWMPVVVAMQRSFGARHRKPAPRA